MKMYARNMNMLKTAYHNLVDFEQHNNSENILFVRRVNGLLKFTL